MISGRMPRWGTTLTLAATLCASVSLSGPSHAQATPPAPDKSAPAVPATDKKVPDDKKVSDADKRAKAADCSKQANAKKLHGTAREEFREACKKK